MNTKNKLEVKKQEVKILNQDTQAILTRIDHSDKRFKFWGYLAFGIISLLLMVGIYYQYQLAVQSKAHIDCIIKDLSTPVPSSAKSKYIDYQTRLSSDCKIKFTQ